MSKVTIEWAENKSNDWRICTIKEGNQTITDVSVNRVNKKGETFPNFDGIIPGAEIECEIWKSPAGKTYMFAPRPQSASKVGGFGGGVKAAQERKEVMIEKAQERKSDSIAYFNSVNCSIELVSKRGMSEMTDQDVELAVVQWREWFLSEYRKYEAKDVTEKRNAI
jgi:hypothetical protein